MNNVFIISDIGVNHNGSFEKAQTLIDQAIFAGVDAIKFQYWSKEYEDKCEWKDKLQGLNLSQDDLKRLREYTYWQAEKQNRNVEWFCTAFDNESFEFVKSLGCNIFKIPNNKYVKEDESLCKNIIDYCSFTDSNLIISISTDDFNFIDNTNNNSVIDEFLDNKYHYMQSHNNIDVSVLYCVSKYPPKLEEIELYNFRDMVQYNDDNIGINIGISDHSSLIEIPIAAVAIGAKVVEVHLTMDKDDIGPDHKASLTVYELKDMIDKIRNIEKTLY